MRVVCAQTNNITTPADRGMANGDCHEDHNKILPIHSQAIPVICYPVRTPIHSQYTVQYRTLYSTNKSTPTEFN